MKKHLFLLSSCLLLAACSNNSSSNPAHGHDADNTGLNVRDRNERAITAGEQSESEADRTITQNIRRAVMKDDSLSTNAKNIKIMTINGVVTLRGPVASDQEKNSIAEKARAVSGVKNIENHLEIISNR